MRRPKWNKSAFYQAPRRSRALSSQTRQHADYLWARRVGMCAPGLETPPPDRNPLVEQQAIITHSPKASLALLRRAIPWAISSSLSQLHTHARASISRAQYSGGAKIVSGSHEIVIWEGDDLIFKLPAQRCSFALVFLSFPLGLYSQTEYTFTKLLQTYCISIRISYTKMSFRKIC